MSLLVAREILETRVLIRRAYPSNIFTSSAKTKLILAAEKKALKQVEKQIDQIWKKRLISGDPFETLLQEEKVTITAFSFNALSLKDGVPE